MTNIAKVVALGAVFSMAAVLLVFQYGQPRIFFAMARDGLLPRWAAKVQRKYARAVRRRRSSPACSSRSGRCIGDAGETYDLTNIGTLFAFALVCIGVIVLRYTDPDRRGRSACRSLHCRRHRRRGAVRICHERACPAWRGSDSVGGS